MNRLLLIIAFLVNLILVSCSTTEDMEEGITGLWKSRDQKSDTPRSLVVIYKYHDTYYGRMIATYDEDGRINDTILEQKDRAPGIVGNPPYCGMDFVYDVKPKDLSRDGIQRYKGKVVDPQKGKVYKAQLWRDGEDLIFRGELFIFGKNIRWPRASTKDLPKGFSMRDVKNFVPEVPQTK
jgi:uncharacterized protein (DUF2147 family)